MVLFLVSLWPVFSTFSTTFPLYDEVLSRPSLQLQRCGFSSTPVSVSTKLVASFIATAVGFVKVFRSDLF
jgi:hypothetical protein